ncbi:hypothetical protein V8G54_018613 [Vigna mungo]|uniref:Uncharacterized protein n=1 Tax=Vigna mungo TaxID=3915 RepID=A0AAQ3RSU7_VIGMU
MLSFRPADLKNNFLEPLECSIERAIAKIGSLPIMATAGVFVAHTSFGKMKEAFVHFKKNKETQKLGLGAKQRRRGRLNCDRPMERAKRPSEARAGSDRRCKRHGAGGTDKERLLAGFQWKGHMDESNIHQNERDLETPGEILGWVTFREVFPESVRLRTKHTGKSRGDVWGQSTVPIELDSVTLHFMILLESNDSTWWFLVIVTADSTVDSLKVQVELCTEDCINLWLCSHKTCPVCHRDLNSPPDDQPLKLGDVVVSSISGEICVDVREEEGLDCGREHEHEVVDAHEEQMFVRSHSTGHSIVMIREEGDDEGKNDDDKYTLRFPEHVLIVNSKHNSTRSCASFKDMT